MSTIRDEYRDHIIRMREGAFSLIPFHRVNAWRWMGELEAALGKDECRSVIHEVETGQHAERYKQLRAETDAICDALNAFEPWRSLAPRKDGIRVVNAQTFEEVTI